MNMSMNISTLPSTSPSADSLAALMRLIEFADSAFPVGTFSFSNGLESAAGTGLVHDAATLDAFLRDGVRQAAFTDGVAALHAHRCRRAEDYAGVLDADRQLLCCKMNAEGRRMSRRMGKKFAELAAQLFDDPPLRQWLDDIRADRTPGCYPVAQGLVFAACDISERALFCALLYGTANTIAGAALRCVRVSHYQTQRLLFALGPDIESLYRPAAGLVLDGMHAFVPQTDILASLHEKGTQRMFMN